MGIGDRVKKILRNVKKIPGLPEAVYKKLKYRLRDIERKIDDIEMPEWDVTRLVSEISSAIEDTIGAQFKAINDKFIDMQQGVERQIDSVKTGVSNQIGELQQGFETQIRNMQSAFESTLSSMASELSSLPGTITRHFEEIKDWTRKLVEDMVDQVSGVFGDIKGLWKKYLPWLIAILAVIMVPFVAPIVLPVVSMIF